MSIARILSAILLFAGLASCGGNSPAQPDAGDGADATPPDGVPSPDAPVACGARSTSDDPAMAALLDWMEDRMGTDAIPGAAIAVVRDGEIAETGLLGVKNNDGCDPITEDTRFRFTPVTQLYTTAAILDAASDGVLDVDAPITQYVPSLTVAGGDLAGVTLHGLVTHTSGWARYGVIDCPDVSLATWFTDHSAERPLWAPAGSIYINTGTGPSLAGLALEQADQALFADAVRDRILTPLGSTATYAYDDVLAGDHATGHELNGTEPAQRVCPLLEPTGSLYGSIHDLALMARMILRGGDGVLTAEAVASMLADQAPHFVPGWANTYGFWRIPYGDVTAYWAAGFGHGFTAEIILVPERSFGFVLLANRQLNAFSRGGSHFRPGDAGLKALELLLDLPAYQWGVNPTAPATWTEFAGTYVDPVGVGSGPRTFNVTFDAQSSELAIDMGGIPVTLAPSYPSVEHGPDVFTGSYLGQYVTIRFWRDGNDQPWAISAAFGEVGPPAFRQ